jgi:hypothetical protein
VSFASLLKAKNEVSVIAGNRAALWGPAFEQQSETWMVCQHVNSVVECSACASCMVGLQMLCRA